MQYNIIDLLLFFIIYGFFGFLMESSFRSIVAKRLVIKGGFLTNCFCPLYGLCGIMIIQIYTLSEITINGRFSSLIIATIGSIIAVTSMEYLTGRILDKIFHHKMWDYSQNPLNLHSYICLDFSLTWGIVALVLSSFVHPIMEVFVYAISPNIKILFVSAVSSILFVNASFSLRKLYPANIIKI